MQNDPEFVRKQYVTDYTSIANRDIMVYEEGSYVQRYVYGLNSERVSAEFFYYDETDRLQYANDPVNETNQGENPASDFAAADIVKIYYFRNLLDSSMLAMDQEGEIITHALYDEWGKPLTEARLDGNFAGIDNINNYTGYTYDYLLDIYFEQNRFYNPDTRQFITRDSIKDGMNWYGYVEGNPVVKTDRTGLDSDLNKYVNDNYFGKISVTIAAERPVENSRIAVDLETGDVGHTFIRLDYGDGTVIYRGFYPYSPLTIEQILQKEDVRGIIRNDSNHDWSAAVTFEITEDQADKINNFMNDFDKDYNMVTMNCTTFSVKALQVAGLKSPTKEHRWNVPDNEHQMIVDNLPSDKWFKDAIATSLLNGLKGYSPADAVQDFKNSDKYVLKYGGATHVGTNGKTN